jgi:hypothetical protein
VGRGGFRTGGFFSGLPMVAYFQQQVAAQVHDRHSKGIDLQSPK